MSGKGDILKKKKCVHVQLDTDTHTFFRRELFTMGLTMQEVFEEFAKLVASNEHRAKKMLESFVTAKLKKDIEGLKVPSFSRELPKFGELDSEKLYNLINDASLEVASRGDDDSET